MDNYEWNHGMDVRMGLFAVDESDHAKARTPRRAASVYRRIIEARAIPADLDGEHPSAAP